MAERPKVDARSTYRRDLPSAKVCAVCVEPIKAGEDEAEESNPAWGNVPMPIHKTCGLTAPAEVG